MKKIRIQALYLKSLVVYLLAVLFIILIVIHSKETIGAVRSALGLCYQTIIPSLFPFFVLSGLLVQTGFVRVAGNFLSPVMRPLFRVGGSGALAFAIGVVSGYPMGAKMVCELYGGGLVTKAEGRRLLPYCNNSGPLFIIGAVGVGMLGSLQAGIFLYVVHLVSALLVGLLFRFYQRGEASGGGQRERIASGVKRDLRGHWTQEQRSLGEIFSDCVRSAVNTTLAICGFIAVFSAFLECLKPAIDALVTSAVPNLVVKGLFEVTLGASSVAVCGLPLAARLVLASALIGFGGLCVHLQVIGIISKTDLGIKTYLAGKMLHGILSAVVSFLALHILNPATIMTWSGGAGYVAQNEGTVLVCFVLFAVAATACLLTGFVGGKKKI